MPGQEDEEIQLFPLYKRPTYAPTFLARSSITSLAPLKCRRPFNHSLYTVIRRRRDDDDRVSIGLGPHPTGIGTEMDDLTDGRKRKTESQDK